MSCEKVILGFSGGIDSTAAALILQRDGYDVSLETLDTTGHAELISGAKAAAGTLGMPLHVTDVRERFRREVVDYFTDSYMRGETPAPCTVCNGVIKWKTLYDIAVNRGFDHIATGHYIRIHRDGEKFFVRKGADPIKDQSYYLWALPQEYLKMALTPMGERIKSDIKTEHGHLVGQRESMGVCFLRGVNYADFMHDNVKRIRPGEIVDRQGVSIGRHDGCALYTIGQKKGLECSLTGAVVTGIDAARNRIIVGTDADLYSTVLTVERCVIPDMEWLLDSRNLEVKVRGLGRNPEGYATVKVASAAPATPVTLEVTLSSPAWAAAKGQPVVFYEGDIVLGGGFFV